jgi:hypothetical protein
MLRVALELTTNQEKNYQALYELSLCVVNDKSTRRNSEDTWLKATKSTLQGCNRAPTTAVCLIREASLPCDAFTPGIG